MLQSFETPAPGFVLNPTVSTLTLSVRIINGEYSNSRDLINWNKRFKTFQVETLKFHLMEIFKFHHLDISEFQKFHNFATNLLNFFKIPKNSLYCKNYKNYKNLQIYLINYTYPFFRELTLYATSKIPRFKPSNRSISSLEHCRTRYFLDRIA